MTDTANLPGAARAWTALTSSELADLCRADPVAILPTAAIEQHGPHLPLSTDVDIGEGVLAAALHQVSAEPPLLLLPTLAPAASPEHTSHPGTLSLDPDTFERTLLDVGRSVARAGIRRLVVFNSHGGNRATIDSAALRLRRRCGLLVVKVHTFRLTLPEGVELPQRELRHGLHGGAVETAIMLHLHPDRVRAAEVRDFPSLGLDLEAGGSRIAPEGAAAFAWLAEDLHPSGATGDASRATPDMGRRIVTAWAGEVAGILEDARGFPLDRLADPDADPDARGPDTRRPGAAASDRTGR